MPQARRSISRSSGTRNLLLAYFATGLLLGGCGVQAYEQRLSNANDLFAYQHRLDEALAPATWRAPGDLGISFRVPRDFSEIAAPAAGTETSAEVDIPDPRQPTYLGIQELPGLIATWRATRPTTDGANAVVFLYLLGNHDRFLQRRPGEEGPDPKEYLRDLESLLETTLGVMIPGSGQGENSRISEVLPRSDKYRRFTQAKEFTSITLESTEQVEKQLSLPPLRVYLYEHAAGPVQVALMLVAPQSVVNADAELRIALETLSVSADPPKPKAPGALAGQRKIDF